MKNKLIFVISDVHMQFSYYQEIIPNNLELLVIAGDLLSFGDDQEARFACSFLEGLMDDKNINEIIWVLGNHDVSVTKDIEYYRLQYPKINFKIKDEFIWNNIKFFVTGYSPFVQERWTNYFSNHLEEKKVMIPLEVPHIIISHCPPSHKDFSYVTDSRVDIGSMELRKYIEENQVKFCFSGHLHFEYSENQNSFIEINNCHCFNVSSKGQLLSLKKDVLKIENFIPTLDDSIYWKCRKNGVRYSHIEFMKFIQYWDSNPPISKEFYSIFWTSSGIQFINLPPNELKLVKEFFIKYYGSDDNIESSMLYKFN
ncbi:MAG: metallophosphoesterase family protein [Fusobacteriaceae bacterium]